MMNYANKSSIIHTLIGEWDGTVLSADHPIFFSS